MPPNVIHRTSGSPMSEIDLQLPEPFIFAVDLQVRISDLDYRNHLSSDAVLKLINEARVRFFDQLGYTEIDIEGVGLVFADAYFVFRSSAFYADLLTVAVAVDGFSRYGCDFFYKISHKGTGQEVARSKSGIVFFDYHQNKMAPVPEAFKRKIESCKPGSMENGKGGSG